MIKVILLAHLQASTLVDGIDRRHVVEAVLGRDPARDRVWVGSPDGLHKGLQLVSVSGIALSVLFGYIFNLARSLVLDRDVVVYLGIVETNSQRKSDGMIHNIKTKPN